MPNTKQVKIYSTPTCVWCKATKEFLDEHKVKYEDINVASDAKAREYMLNRTGQMGVPVIEIGNDVIIGFDEERISELLGIS
jgi:glutaredoxin-like YruB-family protein